MALKIEVARGEYSSLGGLYLFDEMMNLLGLKKKVKDLLPVLKRERNSSSYDKLHALVMGFIAGADCLDDMEDLGEDAGFKAFCGGHVNAATVYGAFLRGFEPWQIRRLNDVLRDVALKLRLAMFPDNRDFILDVDSTAHEQYGEKMEGVAWNYANKWGLDSLQAFDQFGFQYWMDVRSGNTASGSGVPGVIRQVFKGLPRMMNRYLRADSAMCYFDVFNACLDLRVDFVIAMRANMSDPLIGRVRNWKKSKDIRFKDGRECEIGSCVYYQLKGREPLRVVFIRALKTMPDLFGDKYDYAAWVTNIGEHSGLNNEKLILFYRGRGNAENFIKELKNGFDIHHFPCQKILANKVYGLIAALAYNLQRAAGWTLSPKKPRFSKMIRFRMVYLAGQVVKKGRYWIIRLSKTHITEVNHWLGILKMQLLTG
jgi:hypothetical protein